MFMSSSMYFCSISSIYFRSVKGKRSGRYGEYSETVEVVVVGGGGGGVILIRFGEGIKLTPLGSVIGKKSESFRLVSLGN